MSRNLPRSYDSWRTSTPPDAPLSSTRCDCGCGEIFDIGESVLVTHDGERIRESHFDEYARLTLVAHKTSINE